MLYKIIGLEPKGSTSGHTTQDLFKFGLFSKPFWLRILIFNMKMKVWEDLRRQHMQRF